jgi:hypothetical protein
MALHFVGFRDGSQLYRAMRIFGIPDFIHVQADARFVFGGELDPLTDTVVFAEKSNYSSIEQAIEGLKDIFYWFDKKALHTVDDSAIPEDKDGNILEQKLWHFRPLTGQVPW